jgi:hypothetical protein
MTPLSSPPTRGEEPIYPVPGWEGSREGESYNEMLKKKDKYAVAVVGATGAVGNEMILTIEKRDFPVELLRLFASERSEGDTLLFRDSEESPRIPDRRE